MTKPIESADPIGSAVGAARTPRMTPYEITWLIACCARVQSILLMARDRINTTMFEPSEARFTLIWRAIVAASDQYRGLLPDDPVTAKEVIALKCSAEIAADTGRMFYTPTVEQAVLAPDGLLEQMFLLPTGPDVEVQGMSLLSRFVTERLISDPLRKALLGVGPGETVADPAALVAAMEQHTRDVAGIGVDPGSDAVLPDDDFLPPGPKLYTTKLAWLDDILGGGQARQECYAVLGPTGGGKCLARGTLVLMYDGTVRPVENVVVGDLLMGPDSTPRRVLSLGRGREMMYRVSGTDRTSYVVNESHILSLKLTPDRPGQDHKVVNIGVRDYLAASKTFRHRAKGYRVGVEFPQNDSDLTVDPYFLGLWLADGSQDGPTIHKPDAEVLSYLEGVAAGRGLVLNDRSSKSCPSWHLSTGKRGSANSLLDDLRGLGVIGNKHIPQKYLTGNRSVRRELLAGLLDGDGSLKDGRSAYDYSTVRAVLADQVVFLARSLGLRATVSARQTRCQTGAVCNSYRVYISGDVHQIPCRLERKMPPDQDKQKDPTVYGIKVEPVGVDDYYGFTIDGDHLFLLGDFTVTHNTAMMVQLSVEGAEFQSALAAEAGPDVAGHWYYFTYELSEKQLRPRVYQYGARLHADTIRDRRRLTTADVPGGLHDYESDAYVNSPGNPLMGEKERVDGFRKRLAGPCCRLHIVDYSGTHPGQGGGGVDEIAAYLRREAARGRRPVGFVVDYAGLVVNRYIAAKKLRPDVNYQLLESFIDAIRNKVSIPLDCTGWVLHQLHGDVAKRAPGAKVHHSDARGCRNFADNSDFGIQLTNYNRLTGMLAVHCTKHRRAAGREDGVIVRFRGEFGAFVSPDQDYEFDPDTRQIVPKGHADMLHHKAPARGAGGRPPVNPLSGLT